MTELSGHDYALLEALAGQFSVEDEALRGRSASIGRISQAIRAGRITRAQAKPALDAGARYGSVLTKAKDVLATTEDSSLAFTTAATLLPRIRARGAKFDELFARLEVEMNRRGAR